MEDAERKLRALFPHASDGFIEANIQTGVTLKVQPTRDVDGLNKLERAFHVHLLSMRPNWVGVQCITLKLADDTRLTPDFCYLSEHGKFIFIDVKGWQREDALIKMKVAARQFPWATFAVVKREDDRWNFRWLET